MNGEGADRNGPPPTAVLGAREPAATAARSGVATPWHRLPERGHLTETGPRATAIATAAAEQIPLAYTPSTPGRVLCGGVHPDASWRRCCCSPAPSSSPSA